jgi:Uma2 family endonuclease
MAIPTEVTPVDARTYLRLERASETKHELIDGQMIAMSGASYAHNVIVSNLVVALAGTLSGGPCRALASDMRVRAGRTGMYAYPDVVVHCERPRFEDDYFDTLLNPAGLFEVLSPSTEGYDRGIKFARFRGIATLRHYVLVAQDAPRIEHYRRDGETWVLREVTGTKAQLVLDGLDGGEAKLPLAAIYEGVER